MSLCGQHLKTILTFSTWHAVGIKGGVIAQHDPFVDSINVCRLTLVKGSADHNIYFSNNNT